MGSIRVHAGICASIMVVALLASSCIYMETRRTLREAKVLLMEATDLGAAEAAPYYYTSAASLVEDAETVYEEADFDAALDLARRAREQAMMAKKIAYKASEAEEGEGP